MMTNKKHVPQQDLPVRVDVIVIGGGIAGVTSAYQLAKRGLDVLLLEKDDIASEQSGRNQGFVRQQMRDPLEIPLIMGSLELWRGMASELDSDIEWVQGGCLVLASDEKRLDYLRSWATIGAQFGLDSRILTQANVREMLPGYTGQPAGGIYTSSDGQADPRKTMRALADAAIRAGARIICGCTVTAITVAGGRVAGVETERGSVQADAVVCAAGIWTHKLLATIDIDLPQRVMRATMTRTRPVARITDAAVNLGGGHGASAFRQAPSGSLVIYYGKTNIDVGVDSFRHLRMFFPMYLANRHHFKQHFGMHTLQSFRPEKRGAERYELGEPEVNQTFVNESLNMLSELFPSLGPLGVEKAWAGRIEGTPDALPVLEMLRTPAGLVVATGQSNHGFAMGPIFGAVVADLITKGESSFDLKPFQLSRFADGTYGKPKSIS